MKHEWNKSIESFDLNYDRIDSLNDRIIEIAEHTAAAVTTATTPTSCPKRAATSNDCFMLSFAFLSSLFLLPHRLSLCRVSVIPLYTRFSFVPFHCMIAFRWGARMCAHAHTLKHIKSMIWQNLVVHQIKQYKTKKNENLKTNKKKTKNWEKYTDHEDKCEFIAMLSLWVTDAYTIDIIFICSSDSHTHQWHHGSINISFRTFTSHYISIHTPCRQNRICKITCAFQIRCDAMQCNAMRCVIISPSCSLLNKNVTFQEVCLVPSHWQFNRINWQQRSFESLIHDDECKLVREYIRQKRTNKGDALNTIELLNLMIA